MFGRNVVQRKLAPILKCHGKIWYKFPWHKNSVDREWWLLLPMGLWLVAYVLHLLDGASPASPDSHACFFPCNSAPR